MKKWKKRVMQSSAVLTGIVILLALTGWFLIRRVPDWYRPAGMTPAQLDAAAQSAEQKLVAVHNAAVQARADESVARRNATTLAINNFTITFTADEINAFVEKWSVWQTVKQSYARFVTDPYIVFRDGRLILAGRVSELGSVASIHFEPKIDAQGKLRIELVRILAGRLPLPQAVLTRYERQATAGIARRMPAWRRLAAFDSTGLANSSAIQAVMGKLLIDTISQQPIDPVLFIPLADNRTIPVKLLEVKIEEQAITLTFQPMTPAERDALLMRIRQGG